MNSSQSKDIERFLAFAHELADRAADAIMPNFRAGGAVEDKSGKPGFDPVTAADRAAEQVIRAAIAAQLPEHSVLGEEFGTQPGTGDDYCWVIDPIDGTRSFITGYPIWGTLIGLNRKDEPVLGLMNQPFTRERFWASSSGAWQRSPDGDRPLRTRQGVSLDGATVLSTGPDCFATRDDLERFDELSAKVRLRRYGGDCYCYCMLAAGHADLVVESGLHAYDIAALIPIVERAGGIVTTWEGGPAAQGGRIIAAASAELHKAALEVLRG